MLHKDFLSIVCMDYADILNLLCCKKHPVLMSQEVSCSDVTHQLQESGGLALGNCHVCSDQNFICNNEKRWGREALSLVSVVLEILLARNLTPAVPLENWLLCLDGWKCDFLWRDTILR